jgi:ATP-dependent DNA helicase RecG
MINGWNTKYGFKPIIDGDFDFYKITFPTTKLYQNDVYTTSMTTPITTSKDQNNELRILELLTSNPYLTQKDIAGYIGLTTDGVKYHIVNLKKRNKIKRKGSNRKGYWEVINKTK